MSEAEAIRDIVRKFIGCDDPPAFMAWVEELVAAGNAIQVQSAVADVAAVSCHAVADLMDVLAADPRRKAKEE